MNGNKVLAIVESREITDADVEKLLRSLGPQRAAQFQSPEGKRRLVDELVTQELFYVEAKNNTMDQDEEFLAELERMKVDLLRQYAVTKAVSDVTVEDEESFNYYKENRNEFKTPETIHAKHILVEDEKQANQIYFDLKAGLFFEEAAKKYSKCPSAAEGGSLNYFSRGQMVPEFEQAAFALGINEISRPIKTQFGYHIIKLVDKKKPGTSDFDDVKDQINEQMLSMKQSQKYMEESKRLKGKYTVKVNQ